MSTSPRIIAVAVAAAALALPATAAARAKTTYYVALGDSYAQGVQPIGRSQADVPTKKGFNNVVFKKLHKTHPGLKFVELGCGGATTQSMIDGSKRCKEKLRTRAPRRRRRSSPTRPSGSRPTAARSRTSRSRSAATTSPIARLRAT